MGSSSSVGGAGLEISADANPNEEKSLSSPTLLTYVGVLTRRKWVVLPAVVIVPLLAAVLAFVETPLYQASAGVLLNRQSLAASLSGVADSSSALQPERVAQTQADLARVPQVAKRTLTAAAIHDRTPRDFLDTSDVSAKTDADLLEFNVRDRDPAVAIRLATEYARQFIAFRNELESAGLAGARRGVQRRLKQLQSAGAEKSALYAELRAKMQQLDTIAALQATSAFLVRPADSAPQIRPRPVRTGAFGIALGIMLGIGLAFLMEVLDTRVRTAEEIEERLRLPLLARLPFPPRQLDDEQRTVTMLGDADGPYAESIRMLRVRLGQASPTSETHRRPLIYTTDDEFYEPAWAPNAGHVVMVTSATEGEGKSTTVANLAVALAQSGQRVILCDLDARRPVIDRLFGLEARPGLIDVALGMTELDGALKVIATPEQLVLGRGLRAASRFAGWQRKRPSPPSRSPRGANTWPAPARSGRVRRLGRSCSDPHEGPSSRGHRPRRCPFAARRRRRDDAQQPGRRADRRYPSTGRPSLDAD